MTKKTQNIRQWLGALGQTEVIAQGPDKQPVFFFDGDFRTWEQVVQQAHFIRAFAPRLSRNLFQNW